MADLRAFGATSNLIRFVLKKADTGQGLTGLSSGSSGLIISTIADNEATATTYTVAGSTIETIATLGTFATPTATKCRFKEVDATNHKGLYEFQFADARFAVASSKRLVISVTGVANLLDTDYEIELVRFNPFDAQRLGLTALPAADANQPGGLAAIVYKNGTLPSQVGADPTVGTVNLASGGVDADNEGIGGMLVIFKSGLPFRFFGIVTASVNSTDRVTLNNGAAIPAALVPVAGDTYMWLAAPGVTGMTDAQVQSNVQAIVGAAGVSLTNLGDTRIANLDAAMSTRATPADVNTQADLAISNNLDVIAIKAKTDLIPASPATVTGTDAIFNRLGAPVGASISADVAGVPNALLDQTNGVETGMTPRQAFRLFGAALAGVLSGAGTATITIKGMGVASSRIVATVDADGNRSALTLTP